MSYLRVSTEEQTHGYGVARQNSKTTRYITLKGWKHVDTYTDEGVSGSLEAAERGGLKRLMADAQKEPRPFDIVVVPDGRAIGRKGRAFWRWVWALEDIGVFVAVVSDDYDNTTSDGRKKMRRDADYAETEWETIRDRTQGGLQEKAELVEAAHIGGRPPFGYRIEGKGTTGSYLVVNEAEAALIRYVYDLVVTDGLNLFRVATRLNSEGKLNRSGNPWTYVNLRDRILSAPVLEGQIVFRGKHSQVDENGVPLWGQSVTIKLPRILTPDEADLLKRKSVVRVLATRRECSIYPLSGRVIGLCGKIYTGISRASTNSGGRQYRCSGGNSNRPAGTDSCGCSHVDAQALEDHVWGEVVKVIGDGKRLEELAAEWIGLSEGDREANIERISDLDRQIEELGEAITAVTVATAKKTRSADSIAAATAPLDDELQQLERLRDEAAQWLTEVENADRRNRDLQDLAKLARNSFRQMAPVQQAEILDLLEVRVTFTGSVPKELKTGLPCPVSTWYRAAGLDVPAADLSDTDWQTVARLLPRRPGDAIRRSVNAIFYKARTGMSWPEIFTELGVTKTSADHFRRWSGDGTWKRVNESLTHTARVPVWVPELLPQMTIEGRVDPRMMLSAAEPSRR
ncbi:recombinase family protein [Streptomyces sp. NPDC056161]|uniref:recombinase family protein n=1 Tax=Streptomyces sp. NPDC056161 TaxID=3345732 RepID=UPI0035DEC1D8